jgi:hypothetical protein
MTLDPQTTSLTALTWADAIKLAVPVLAAVALVWIRFAHERRSERKGLEQALISGFGSAPRANEGVAIELGAIPAVLSSGQLFSAHLEISSAYTDIAKRLTVLDPAQAGLYANYVAAADIFRGHLAYLKALLTAYVTAASPSDTLHASMGTQALVLRDTVRELTEAELQILEALAKAGLARPPAELLARYRWVRRAVDRAADA